MIKSDLVTNIKKKFPYLSDADCLLCVNQMIEFMAYHLSIGNKFEIRGFGTFAIKRRDARMVRNPKTGETMHRNETAYPSFKSGKMLKERVNKVNLASL